MRHYSFIRTPSVKRIIQTNKDLFKRSFPSKKKTSKRGRPPVAETWLVKAIVVLLKAYNFTFKQMHQYLLQEKEQWMGEDWLNFVPSKQTLHRYFKKIEKPVLERLVKKLGVKVIGEAEGLDVAVDSSGFETGQGSAWSRVKWARGVLKKTSSYFRKAHLLVEWSSHAILGVKLTKSRVHDAVGFGGVMVRVGKRLWRRMKRLHGDKAYFSQDIALFCFQEGIFPVLSCRKNAKTHEDGVLSYLARLQLKHVAIWAKNFRASRRSCVEHVLGLVKQRGVILRGRSIVSRDKELLCHFVRYNAELLLEKEVMH